MESFQFLATRLSAIVLLACVWAVLMSPTATLAAPPSLEKAKGGECVRPPEWMRRNHMDFLKDKRVMTVRDGVRIRSESFLKCAECHSSRERFCERCHSYVGVAPDCFECHNYPK